MEIYLIAAISFGIMFFHRYIRDIVHLVKAVAKIHDVENRDILLYFQALVLFIASIVLFPFYLVAVLRADRPVVIMNFSRSILLKHYDVELEISS